MDNNDVILNPLATWLQVKNYSQKPVNIIFLAYNSLKSSGMGTVSPSLRPLQLEQAAAFVTMPGKEKRAFV